MYRKIFTEEYVKNGFSFEEAISETDFALEILFNFSYKNFMLGKTLEPLQIEKLKNVIHQRVLTKRPIQQIIGQAFFYNRRFFVNENTLIPRPETELLVEETLKIAKNLPNPAILDIGTGTGCIPITLALENNNIKVDSVDISLSALEVANKNLIFHNAEQNVRLFKSDLFKNVNKKYNIIVSNPPYIPKKDKNLLQPEVRDFDPELALFADDELGIEFYEKIIISAKEHLLQNSYIIFEIGVNQSQYIADLLKYNNYALLDVIKDYNSIDRIIIAKN